MKLLYQDTFFSRVAQPQFSPCSSCTHLILTVVCLQEEKFREVSEALRLAQIQWTKRGPPNKRWATFDRSVDALLYLMLWRLRPSAFRCYEAASLESLPEAVTSCWELLHSEAFFLLLSNFTGLRLHYLCPAGEEEEDEKEEQEGEAAGSSTRPSTSAAANESRQKGKSGMFVCFPQVCLWALMFVDVLELSTPVCCGEVRRWTHGSYTLLHDGEAAQAEYALDLILPFGCTGKH